MNEIVVKIETEDDIYLAISRIRSLIRDTFAETDQQAIFITVLELGKNVLDYAFGKGTITYKRIEDSP